MPNIKSAKKRVLVAEKKTLQNKAVKTGLKTALKKADAAASSGSADSAAAEEDPAQKRRRPQEGCPHEEAGRGTITSLFLIWTLSPLWVAVFFVFGTQVDAAAFLRYDGEKLPKGASS